MIAGFTLRKIQGLAETHPCQALIYFTTENI
jgi:hypothetical protein